MKKYVTQFLIILAFSFLLLNCSHQRDVRNIPLATNSKAQFQDVYIIKPGDTLDIKFFYNPELNETLIVRPDGKITLQLIDDVYAEGLTPEDLDKTITEKFSKELRKPQVSVIVKDIGANRVYVGGEVGRPGEIQMPKFSNMTVAQALFQAGGFLDTAEPENTIIIRKGKDNRPIPMRVNLLNTLTGKNNGATFILKPHDIIYVSKSYIAQANLWVHQYIERLILFRGISFGFSYRVDDKGND